MSNDAEKTEAGKKLILELFVRKAGIVSQLCAAANISRATYYRWQKEDKAFAAEIADKQEELIDYAESHLMKAIDGGNMTAIIFFLKCKAKKRGYVERQEWSGPDGGPVPVKMYDFNPSKYPLALPMGGLQEDGEDEHGHEDRGDSTAGGVQETQSPGTLSEGGGEDGIQCDPPKEPIAEGAKDGGGDGAGAGEPQ